MGDNLAGPLCQSDKDVERAATKQYPLLSLLEQPLGRKQTERAKRKHLCRL